MADHGNLVDIHAHATRLLRHTFAAASTPVTLTGFFTDLNGCQIDALGADDPVELEITTAISFRRLFETEYPSLEWPAEAVGFIGMSAGGNYYVGAGGDPDVTGSGTGVIANMTPKAGYPEYEPGIVIIGRAGG